MLTKYKRQESFKENEFVLFVQDFFLTRKG